MEAEILALKQKIQADEVKVWGERAYKSIYNNKKYSMGWSVFLLLLLFFFYIIIFFTHSPNRVDFGFFLFFKFFSPPPPQMKNTVKKADAAVERVDGLEASVAKLREISIEASREACAATEARDKLWGLVLITIWTVVCLKYPFNDCNVITDFLLRESENKKLQEFADDLQDELDGMTGMDNGRFPSNLTTLYYTNAVSRCTVMANPPRYVQETRRQMGPKGRWRPLQRENRLLQN